MHNIGFVVTLFETESGPEYEVEFFVRIGSDIVRGTLAQVLVAIRSEEMRQILEAEVEDLYEILLDHLTRRQTPCIVEANIFMRGRFSAISLAGMEFSAPFFKDVTDVLEWLADMTYGSTATNPSP